MTDESERRGEIGSSQRPVEPNMFGHTYALRYRTPDGYGVCSNCGCSENTARAAKECPNPSGISDPAAYLEELREKARQYDELCK